jgi:hypothetical protein
MYTIGAKSAGLSELTFNFQLLTFIPKVTVKKKSATNVALFFTT